MGTEKQRRAAIESSAQLVTINYDNMVWLVENYGADWPFDMVVCDEASRNKSARCSIQTSKTGKQFLTGQGGKRAKCGCRMDGRNSLFFAAKTRRCKGRKARPIPSSLSPASPP